MAEVLKKYVFHGKKSSRHPWEQWLDGRVWQLHKGQDFATSAANFTACAYCAAKRFGKKVRTSIKEDVVTLQAYVPESTP